jgi:hypothetical protein
MGRGARDFFPVSKGYRSLPEINLFSLPSPSPFLTPWFELSFCTLCRVLNEEVVCPCF